MKTFFTFIMALLFSMQAFAYEITVYGLNTCGYCSATRADLTKEGIKFIFWDVNENSSKATEMFALVRKYNLDNGTGTVLVPVVKIVVGTKEYCYVRPTIAQIKAILLTPASDIAYNNISLVFYPNPCKNILHISGGNGIKICGMDGKCILTSEESEINISCLKPGNYIVISRDSRGILVKQ